MALASVYPRVVAVWLAMWSRWPDEWCCYQVSAQSIPEHFEALQLGKKRTRDHLVDAARCILLRLVRRSYLGLGLLQQL